MKSKNEKNGRSTHPSSCDHLSRREFLEGAAAAASSVAIVTSPLMLGLSQNEALAASSPPALTPTLHIHLAGGPLTKGAICFDANADGTPTDASNQVNHGVPASYMTGSGLVAAQTGITSPGAGVPFFNSSMFTLGMKQLVGADALANTTVLVINSTSQSDSSANAFGLHTTLAFAGGNLSIADSSLFQNTASGVSAVPFAQNPNATRIVATSLDTVMRSGTFTTTLAQAPMAAIRALAQGISKATAAQGQTALSGGQAAFQKAFQDVFGPVASRPDSQVTRDAMNLGASPIGSLLGVSGLTSDQLVQGSTMVAQQNMGNNGNPEMILGANLLGLLTGAFRVATFVRGGNDYHGQNAGKYDFTGTVGNTTVSGVNAVEYFNGRALGLAIQSAHLLQKPLDIVITLDGGMTANSGTGGDDFTDPGKPKGLGDRDQRSGIAYIMYRPTGAMKPTRAVLGSVNTDDRSNDPKDPFEPQLMGMGALVLNKLAVDNALSLAPTILQATGLTTAQISTLMSLPRFFG